jgi:hypothetical protein
MRPWIYKLILFVIISANISSAVPAIPMVISGNVSINDEPAPVGTEVKALMDGDVLGSYVVLKKGIYGMIVENRPGIKSFDIYVNGIKSGTTAWSSEPKILNLAITVKGSSPVGKSSLSSGAAITNTGTTTINASTTTAANVKTEVEPEIQKTGLKQELQATQGSSGQESAKIPGFNFLYIFISIILIYSIIKTRGYP